ncbi:acyl-CoA synthetase [soil metagenome]
MGPPPVPRSFNLADLWEAVAARVPEREALVCGARRRTYADLEERANRLAHHLSGRGIGPGDHVGLQLGNGSEYLEVMLAAFKVRAVPINVNYRYVAGELRHLFTDAGLVALVVHRRFAAHAAGVVGDLDHLRTVAVVEDGSGADVDGLAAAGPEVVDYEDALAVASPAPPVVTGRSGDDRYVIYTGGTTGRPKGVVWRQEDAFFACIGGGDPMRLQGPVERPEQVVERIIDGSFCALPLAPLMHAAAQWTSLSWLLAGGKVVLMPGSLDPPAVWQAVQDEGVNLLIMVGDAVGRPLIEAWEAARLEAPRSEAGPVRWDASSLLSLSNGGAPMTPALKDRLAAAFPSAVLVDGFGSSETGAQGSQRRAPGETYTGVTQFSPYGDTVVLDEDRRPVPHGSGTVGVVAAGGRIPLGYRNDPDRTAATFVEVEGRRWAFTGDMATVSEDGTIALLGRGSGCINTGGEKVFPEEVEGALLTHPQVRDALVVGVADERWGQRVTAVVEPAEGSAPVLDDLVAHCRRDLAGYKVPKALVVVDRVERSPAGKADYRWARSVAVGAGK